MPAFTVQKIIDRAAAAADMHDNFVPTATWIDWLNSELTALTILAARSGWSIGPVSQVTVQPTGLYTHPTEMFAVLGVWEVDPSWRHRRLRVNNLVDNIHQDSIGPITGPARDVSVVPNAGGTLDFRFFPIPTQNTYKILFIPPPAEVATVADTVNLPMGTEERLVVGMAIRALEKEESDTAKLERRLVKEDARIEELAWSRTLTDVPRVRNVDYQDRGWVPHDSFVVPGPESWLWL